MLWKIARVLGSIQNDRKGRKNLRERVRWMPDQAVAGGNECGSVKSLGCNLQQVQRNHGSY